MKPQTKAAAVTAVKWAAGLSAGFVLGPIVMGLASGTAVLGKLIAEKLIVGVAWFPILFFGLWAWGALSKKAPVTGAALDSKTEATTTPPIADRAGNHVSTPLSGKPKKWNYVGIGAGVFMLLFLFLPQLISGTLANQYYLGAAFWVGVIIYCSMNIARAKERSNDK
jgi:hypothetical protein